LTRRPFRRKDRLNFPATWSFGRESSLQGPADIVLPLPKKYRKRRFDVRWNDLRRIGNSTIAKASIAVPLLGYLILFHSGLLEYLKLHASMCKDCTVSWRIYMLYFACCAFAVGSVIYAWRCPQVIKSYQVSRDYFETEKDYYRDPLNLDYLFRLFDEAAAEPADHGNLRPRTVHGSRPLDHDEMFLLSGLMGQFYFMENRKHYWSRLSVAASYAIGFLLLGIPAVVTFVEVIRTFSRTL
jgi:hypothetical protein